MWQIQIVGSLAPRSAARRPCEREPAVLLLKCQRHEPRGADLPAPREQRHLLDDAGCRDQLVGRLAAEVQFGARMAGVKALALRTALGSASGRPRSDPATVSAAAEAREGTSLKTSPTAVAADGRPRADWRAAQDGPPPVGRRRKGREPWLSPLVRSQRQ